MLFNFIVPQCYNDNKDYFIYNNVCVIILLVYFVSALTHIKSLSLLSGMSVLYYEDSRFYWKPSISETKWHFQCMRSLQLITVIFEASVNLFWIHLWPKTSA